MTVRLEATIKRFIGTSHDDKPTADVPEGSSFLETDTGQIRRFTMGRWTGEVGLDEQAQLLGAILAEVAAIRERFEAVID